MGNRASGLYIVRKCAENIPQKAKWDTPNGKMGHNKSRVLGHTNIVTTQLYAKITTEKTDKDLTMFGNQLNQSFGNTIMA